MHTQITPATYSATHTMRWEMAALRKHLKESMSCFCFHSMEFEWVSTADMVCLEEEGNVLQPAGASWGTWWTILLHVFGIGAEIWNTMRSRLVALLWAQFLKGKIVNISASAEETLAKVSYCVIDKNVWTLNWEFLPVIFKRGWNFSTCIIVKLLRNRLCNNYLIGREVQLLNPSSLGCITSSIGQGYGL